MREVNCPSFIDGAWSEEQLMRQKIWISYVCLLGYVTKILSLCVSNLKNFEQELFEFSSMSNGLKKLWLSELGVHGMAS